MSNVTCPRRPALLIAAPMLLWISLAPSPIAAQCSTTCGPGGGGMSCSVMLTQSPCAANGAFLCTAYPSSQTIVTTAVIDSTNADCLPGAGGDSLAMAVHTAGQGLPAECVFRFRVARCSSIISCTAAAPALVDCTVDDTSDGLPVELMEFSVGEEAEQPPADG